MKSLELNWIRNFDKSLVIPEVIFHRMDNAGAMYMPPRNNEVYDEDGKPHDMKFGVIVINPDYPCYFEPHLAHEWRHHWQHFHGWKYDGIGKQILNELKYENAVYKYFTESYCEMDALRFQKKHSYISELWEELLYRHL